MDEKIEILREELYQLTEDDTCLYSEKILKLSQKLDKLINSYYENIMYKT